MEEEILQYLYGLERFGIKLGLEAVTELLDILGNPHQKYKSVNIAGTTGKGSTAAFFATSGATLRHTDWSLAKPASNTTV